MASESFYSESFPVDAWGFSSDFKYCKSAIASGGRGGALQNIKNILNISRIWY
jgi:hypothetical protein